MTDYTPSLNDLIEQLKEFPGVGERTAERLAFHVLNNSEQDVNELREALKTVQENTRSCSRCFHVTETDPCDICSDPERNQEVLCICESPRDLIALENSGEYNGLYHVLLGTLDPLEGVDPEDLTLSSLEVRIRNESFEEIIVATNPTAEGDGTALYLERILEHFDGRVTRLARGIPSGSSLEYASPSSVAEALSGRQPFSGDHLDPDASFSAIEEDSNNS